MNQTQQLMRAVQALAQPAHIQVALFPDFVVIGDELALDFGDAYERYRSTDGLGLTPEQNAALGRLDCELERLSGPADPAFWLDRAALETDSRWHNLRELARSVLREMGWPDTRPDPSDAIYVRGGKE